MAALTTALMALTAAQTISSYAGQRRQANSAVQQGNYQGSIYDQNAGLDDQQASDALARGRESELQRGRMTRQVMGAQRAGYAGQGVNVSSGSALDVRGDTAYLGALDQQTIRTNAAREAWGFSTQAAQNRQAAGQARAAGQNVATDLRAGATGTLLTGALNVYGQGQNAGTWGQGGKKGTGMITSRGGWGGSA